MWLQLRTLKLAHVGRSSKQNQHCHFISRYVTVLALHAASPISIFSLLLHVPVLNPGFVDMHGLMLYYVFGQARMEIHLATTQPIETWLAIAWSGSVLYRVSSYMIFMYKTFPSFQQKKKVPSVCLYCIDLLMGLLVPAELLHTLILIYY